MARKTKAQQPRNAKLRGSGSQTRTDRRRAAHRIKEQLAAADAGNAYSRILDGLYLATYAAARATRESKGARQERLAWLTVLLRNVERAVRGGRTALIREVARRTAAPDDASYTHLELSAQSFFDFASDRRGWLTNVLANLNPTSTPEEIVGVVAGFLGPEFTAVHPELSAAVITEATREDARARVRAYLRGTRSPDVTAMVRRVLLAFGVKARVVATFDLEFKAPRGPAPRKGPLS